MPRIFALIFPSLLLVSGSAYLFSTQEKEEISIPLVTSEVIGSSVEDRQIFAHHIGKGEQHIVIVGGIHGGYEWNTTSLSEALITHFTLDPLFPTDHVTLSIIPVLNPDGLYAVAGTTTDLASLSLPKDPTERTHGRFNANTVDLNRNFNCNWQKESTWGTQTVSAGTAPFSEPEAQALAGFIERYSPDAVIFLHSKANAVYGSECTDGVLHATKDLLQVYADASGYTPIERFDSYPITGDAEGWLASLGIPAITVELATHEDIEFEKNLKGVTAVLEWMVQE